MKIKKQSIHTLTVNRYLPTTDCRNISWEHVISEPELPVLHGTVVLLSCQTENIMGGESRAICQDSILRTTNGETPFCMKLGN